MQYLTVTRSIEDLYEEKCLNPTETPKKKFKEIIGNAYHFLSRMTQHHKEYKFLSTANITWAIQINTRVF